MVIDLKCITENSLPNFQGGDKEMVVRMFTDDDNKIFSAYLEPGASVGEHSHHGTSEIIFITNGEGIGTVDGIKTLMTPGMVQYCHSGHSHSLVNNSNTRLEFLTVVCKQE